MRKTVLFLAFFFPPVPCVACIRSWNVAKELARNGWNVVVVTPSPELWDARDDPEGWQQKCASEGIKVIHTDCGARHLPYRLMNRGKGKLGRGIGYVLRALARRYNIDAGVGWLKPLRAALNGISPGDVDVVLATGGPFTSFVAASELAQRLKCPYVLDYRDLWTLGDDWAQGMCWKKVIQLEGRCLAGSALVIGVSPSLNRALELAFQPKTPMRCITNGFDEEELGLVEPAQKIGPTIIYAGTLIPPKRLINPVVEALSHLQRDKELAHVDWAFNYYGDSGQQVLEEGLRWNILGRVKIFGLQPRLSVLGATKSASVAVVISTIFDSNEPSDLGILTGKLFELMGIGVPILFIGPEQSDARVIIGNNGCCVRGSDIRTVAEVLKRHLLSPRRHEPDMRYSWECLGKRYSDVLREIV